MDNTKKNTAPIDISTINHEDLLLPQDHWDEELDFRIEASDEIESHTDVDSETMASMISLS